MTSKKESCPMLLSELELLREENEFLQSLVDSQNLIVQSLEEELKLAQEEIERTNQDLCEAFTEIELKLIEFDKFEKGLLQQVLVMQLTINDSFFFTLNLFLKTQNLRKLSELEIMTKTIQLKEASKDTKEASKNVREASKDLRIKLKNQFHTLNLKYNQTYLLESQLINKSTC